MTISSAENAYGAKSPCPAEFLMLAGRSTQHDVLKLLGEKEAGHRVFPFLVQQVSARIPTGNHHLFLRTWLLDNCIFSSRNSKTFNNAMQEKSCSYQRGALFDSAMTTWGKRFGTCNRRWLAEQALFLVERETTGNQSTLNHKLAACG